MRRLSILSLLAAAFMGALIAPAEAQSKAAQLLPAKARCEALAATDFSTITDAPTQVLKSTFFPSSPARVAYCAVEANVSPTVGIGLWLPADNWNGKYIVRGCGGFCGSIEMELACKQHLRDGYACLHTDMGHKSTMVDGKWAYNNLQGVVDFGFRATHVATVAGKAITENFYSKSPRYSYFMACSTGGRQGMVEAERFPRDFDGISVIAPVIDETGAGVQLLWSTTVNRDANGHEILTAAKIPALHQAVIKSCDMNDGIKDGLIGDPRDCKFDPASTRCKAGDKPDCLTDAQIAVVRKIYSGPTDSKGKSIYTGGAQPGSELAWVGAYLAKDGADPSYARMQAELWRYMGFWPNPGPSWTAKEFDFDRDPQRLGIMEALYSGSNPDLRKFKAAGGKLIAEQGWADQSVVPLNIVDYYDLVTRTMGGHDATVPFFRLFMVPGMIHCSGGEAAYGIDHLAALEDWVEKGIAPEKLIGVRPKNAADLDYFSIDKRFLKPDQIAFSRPYFAYPGKAVYAGKGNPDDATSFIRK